MLRDKLEGRNKENRKINSNKKKENVNYRTVIIYQNNQQKSLLIEKITENLNRKERNCP